LRGAACLQACHAGTVCGNLHAYCLMRNHFHLVAETPQANLVAGMKWLLGVYNKRHNNRHKTCGHLFAGRYKSLVAAGSGNGYLRTLCDYVHLNPVRAKLIRPGSPLGSYRRSNYGQYLKPPNERPCWMRMDRLLGEKGVPNDSRAGRAEFARLMEGRRREEESSDYRAVRRGWCLGGAEFRRKLLASIAERSGPGHCGADGRKGVEAKAERMVAEGLRRLGWTEIELRRRRKRGRGQGEAGAGTAKRGQFLVLPSRASADQKERNQASRAS
jgi:putative transposase